MTIPGLKEVREYLRQRIMWEAKAKATHYQNMEIVKSRPKPKWQDMEKMYPEAFAYIEIEKYLNGCYEDLARETLDEVESGVNPTEALEHLKKRSAERIFDTSYWGIFLK